MRRAPLSGRRRAEQTEEDGLRLSRDGDGAAGGRVQPAPLAAYLGGEEAVARHHAAGKLPVWERINHLLDPGSFQEVGSLAGRAEYEDRRLVSLRLINVVRDLGTVDGRDVVVGGEDCTVRGGAAVGGKSGSAKWLALGRLLLIHLINGTGGSVRTLELIGRTYIPDNPGLTTVVRVLGTVPVIVRKCYGVAGGGSGRHGALELRSAWPSAVWGSLPVEAASRRAIAAAPNPEAKRQELEEKLPALRSPFRTAEAFRVEEIIDPRDTRPLLCHFGELASRLLATPLGRRTRSGPRP